MTPTPDVRIEPFRCHDLKGVLKLHTICFTTENNFAIRLGQEFLRTTYEFFLVDAKCFGFVAKCKTEVIGVLVGRLDYYTAALNSYRISSAVKAFARHPMLVLDQRLLRKGLKVTVANAFRRRHANKIKLAPSHAEGKTATLASFCIHPDYRHLKVGDRLLSLAEGLCHGKGMQYLRTGVRRNNVASRFSFRRRGYLEDHVLSTDDDLLYYFPLVTTASCNTPTAMAHDVVDATSQV